jgi:hypothetical protein
MTVERHIDALNSAIILAMPFTRARRWHAGYRKSLLPSDLATLSYQAHGSAGHAGTHMYVTHLEC